MAFVRTVATAATTVIAACAFSSYASSSSSKSHQPKYQNLSFFSSQSLSLLSSDKLPLVKNITNSSSAVCMDAPTSDHKPSSQGDQELPELLTEYMVDMKCEGCVNAVKNKLQTVTGVKNVEVDLSK